MADKKISALPAASALDADDLIPMVEDGTTVKATVAQLLALSAGGTEVPFTPSVGTDQTSTMTAAITALPATGGVVTIPEGTFYSKILISGRSGVTFRGAGMDATTIAAPTTEPIVSTSGTPRGGYTFEDMTFDMATNTADGAMAIYPDDHDVTFRRCRFNIYSYGVAPAGAVNPTFEDCEFYPGTLPNTGPFATALFCSEGVRGLRWIRSKARFLRQGIVFDSTPHDEIDIDGGLLDGGWYLLPTRTGGYTNSGGTVTYSATVLTDSAASFGTLDTSSAVNVRVLPVLESGSTGTTYSFNYLNDAAATFVAAAVQPGHIVRTATKWAVVARVVSETRLYVEEWFDSTSWRPTAQPAAAAAYTVHRVLLGLVASNTATTITVPRWSDFVDGAVVTPAAGTLYEVLINHGGYSGIHASAAAPQASGAIRRIRVHGGCHITRTWNDQLSIYGSDSRLVVDPTVLIDHGEDFGITSHGDQARIFGTVVHSGACGIYISGDECQINAYVSGSPYINIADGYLADVLISGDRTRTNGTVAVASGVWSRYGIVVAGPRIDSGNVDSVDLTGSTASGYSVADYKLYSLTTPTVTVTNTVIRNVSGGIVEDGASGTVTASGGPDAHLLITNTSRWWVPGGIWLGPSANTTYTLDRIYYEPFLVLSPITITNLGIDVIVNAAAGKTARLNIYSMGSDGTPATRQIADGTVPIDATGLQQRSGLSTVLQPGLYCSAVTCEANVGLRTPEMTTLAGAYGSNTDLWSTVISGVYFSATYAALPASAPGWPPTAISAGTSGGYVTAVFMKWTS